MKRTLIERLPETVPKEIRTIALGARIYDSSCSPEARVYFIDKDNGYYLKCSESGGLKKEAKMTAYFHSCGLGVEPLTYVSGERDWLLSARAVGEDCTHIDYIGEPKKLCEVIAERLRALHEMSAPDCPIKNHTDNYITTVEENYRTGNYDTSHFPNSFGYATAEEAIAVFRDGKHALKRDTLLHGDYCLPNIILDNWHFSAFIDLGNGGIGDRHVDLFWGAWTLWFNLKTDEYRERFFDAYGKDKIDKEILNVVRAAEVFG